MHKVILVILFVLCTQSCNNDLMTICMYNVLITNHTSILVKSDFMRQKNVKGEFQRYYYLQV
jgi:hypothetical protein